MSASIDNMHNCINTGYCLCSASFLKIPSHCRVTHYLCPSSGILCSYVSQISPVEYNIYSAMRCSEQNKTKEIMHLLYTSIMERRGAKFSDICKSFFEPTLWITSQKHTRYSVYVAINLSELIYRMFNI